jgi:hypothetical protein
MSKDAPATAAKRDEDAGGIRLRKRRPRERLLHPLSGLAEASSTARGKTGSPAALRTAIRHVAAGRETDADVAAIRRAYGDPHLGALERDAVEAYRKLDAHDAAEAARVSQARTISTRVATAKRAQHAADEQRRATASDTEAVIIREDQRAVAPVLYRLFSSNDAEDHERAVAELHLHNDDWLAGLQREFFAMHRQSMYAWLLREGKQTRAYAEALSLLRASHSGNIDDRTKFENEISTPDAQSFHSLVNYLSAGFGGGPPSHKQGYEMLLRQPAAVLARLGAEKADYRIQEVERDGKGSVTRTKIFSGSLLDFLIDRVPRTELSVRSIAILRSHKTDAAKIHVELAAEIIPPSGEDARTRVVRTLGDMKQAAEGERSVIETTYNEIFEGVGHVAGSHSPDTLRGHLKSLEGRFDVGHYHHTLALLYHKPTPAEELYFTLPRYEYADVHGAIGKLREFVQANLSRDQLQADWNRYVSKVQPGNSAPFTTLPLLPHISSVLRKKYTVLGRSISWGDGAAELQIGRLMSSLNAEAVDPQAAQLEETARRLQQESDPRDPAQREHRQLLSRELLFSAEETRKRHAEQPRLDAAEAAISRHVDATDAERIAALKQINGIHTARIERATQERDSIAHEPTLPEPVRKALIKDLGKAIAQAEYEAGRARKKLVGVIDSDQSGLSNAAQILGRVALMSRPTEADEFYVLAAQHEYKQATELVTKVWARGGIDKLLKDAATAHVDTVTGVERPAYSLSRLARSQAPSNPGITDLNVPQALGETAGRLISAALPHIGKLEPVYWLAQPDYSNVHRGVAVLHVILDPSALFGKSAADLSELIKFLETPGFDAALRRDVIEKFVELYVVPLERLREKQQKNKSGVSKSLSPVEAFLTYIFGRFEGQSENYMALRALLLPATSDRERAADAVQLERLGAGSVIKNFSDWWEEKWGTHRREATARSNDWLRYIAQASPEELAQMKRESGLAEPDKIGAYYFEQFKQRRTTLRALEDAVVDRIADLVEVAVEGIITVVSGGAALPAVIAAMSAAVANIAVHEVAQGKNFKLVAWDNVNAVLQAGIGAYAVEGGLRDKVVKIIELKRLEKAGAAGRWAQEWTQNAVTGIIESLMSSTVDLTFGALTKEFGLSAEDIAKQRDLLLGKVAAKGVGTLLTMNFHPGLYHVEQAVAPRFFVQVMFKTGLRIDSVAKEIVKLWYSSKTDAPFLDSLTDIALKVGFGEIKSIGKAISSTVLGHGHADSDREFVTRFHDQHPEKFAAEVLKSVSKRYADTGGEELRAKVEIRKKEQPKSSHEDAVLHVLATDALFAQQVHKDVRKAAEAVFAEKPDVGYKAFGKTGGVPLVEMIDRKDMEKRMAADSASKAPTPAQNAPRP